MSEQEIPAAADAAMRRNPQHPGRIIAEGCIGPDAVGHGGAASITAAAARLGCERKTLSRVIHGHRPIAPDLALRLESEGWGSAETWLWLQERYDLAQLRASGRVR